MNNRRRGTLIGLAVGDALGAAVEFSDPGSFAPVTGYRSGGPHRLNPGEWTDDTSMALALAGAFWSESQIPGSLWSGLARMDMIEGALAGIV
jgi:ADP-ribosylglycohydrolase